MNEQRPPAAEMYADSVNLLRSRDVVGPVESLRRETFALLEGIQVVRNTEEAEAALPAQRATLEHSFAISVALLDYGGERGMLEIGWMLQMLATQLGEKEGDPVEPMLALALRDLSFSLLADCLLRSRLEALPRLGAVSIPGRFERESWPIFQAAGLRHPTALGRRAEAAYVSWSKWLSSSELAAAFTHVRDPEAYEGAIAEAELVAALAFAQRHGDRSFCAVIGAGGTAERRLRGHRRDANAAAALAQLLGIEEEQLDEVLNRLYSALSGGPFGGSQGQLIIDRESE